MAKPNYRFDKRQRELARLKKQEEKRLKKQARSAAAAAVASEAQPGELPPADAKETT